MQRAADVLVTRGLLSWQDNPDHKRARLLGATKQGLALRQAADLAGLERATRVVHRMDAELIERTVTGLHTIREQLEANLRTIAAPAGELEREPA